MNGSAKQLLALERDLRESLRGGYLFGNFDEPLDAAGLRVVRVIQQRISDLPCECRARTPDVGGFRCRACGGRIAKAANLCPSCGGGGLVADMAKMNRTGDPHVNRVCRKCRGTGRVPGDTRENAE